MSAECDVFACAAGACVCVCVFKLLSAKPAFVFWGLFLGDESVQFISGTEQALFVSGIKQA